MGHRDDLGGVDRRTSFIIRQRCCATLVRGRSISKFKALQSVTTQGLVIPPSLRLKNHQSALLSPPFTSHQLATCSPQGDRSPSPLRCFSQLCRSRQSSVDRSADDDPQSRNCRVSVFGHWLIREGRLCPTSFSTL